MELHPGRPGLLQPETQCAKVPGYRAAQRLWPSFNFAPQFRTIPNHIDMSPLLSGQQYKQFMHTAAVERSAFSAKDVAPLMSVVAVALSQHVPQRSAKEVHRTSRCCHRALFPFWEVSPVCRCRLTQLEVWKWTTRRRHKFL